MEFFEYVTTNIDSKFIQQNITIKNLSKYCESVDSVLSHQGERGEIYCLWGEFVIIRECISGGIRFSLPSCPNNIAWTITQHHEPEVKQIVIHLTMNRETHEKDFIESIQAFVAGWKHGLSLDEQVI